MSKGRHVQKKASFYHNGVFKTRKRQYLLSQHNNIKNLRWYVVSYHKKTKYQYIAQAQRCILFQAKFTCISINVDMLQAWTELYLNRIQLFNKLLHLPEVTLLLFWIKFLQDVIDKIKVFLSLWDGSSKEQTGKRKYRQRKMSCTISLLSDLSMVNPHVSRAPIPQTTPCFWTKHYVRAIPTHLFCPIIPIPIPIPILTPLCQTTIFAHLRQRAAGFAIEYSAAFESDRQRQAVATGRHRNTSQGAYTQEQGRPKVTDMLTQTHKQKYDCDMRIFFPLSMFLSPPVSFHCYFFLVLFLSIPRSYSSDSPVKDPNHTVNYGQYCLYSRLYIMHH